MSWKEMKKIIIIGIFRGINRKYLIEVFSGLAEGERPFEPSEDGRGEKGRSKARTEAFAKFKEE